MWTSLGSNKTALHAFNLMKETFGEDIMSLAYAGKRESIGTWEEKIHVTKKKGTVSNRTFFFDFRESLYGWVYLVRMA